MKKIISLLIALINIFTFYTTAYADAPVKSGSLDEADIIAVGDLLCLNAQLNAAKKGSSYDFNYVFNACREDFTAADLTIGNLETCLAGEKAGLTTPIKKENILDKEGNPILDVNSKPKTKTIQLPKINAPLSFADSLKSAGFDYVVTANNHTLDSGNSGVEATISALRERDIAFNGTSDNGDRNVNVISINNIKLCILSYTMFLNSGNEPPKSAETVNIYSKKACGKDINTARNLGAEYIIVYMHWGDENKPVNSAQRQTAAELTELGADLILGSHPHVLQTTEYFRQSGSNKPVLCVYSLGNFISSMATTANKDTISLHIKLRRWQDGRVHTILTQYKPYYSGNNFCVQAANQNGADRIANTVGDSITPVKQFYFGK